MADNVAGKRWTKQWLVNLLLANLLVERTVGAGVVTGRKERNGRLRQPRARASRRGCKGNLRFRLTGAANIVARVALVSSEMKERGRGGKT